MAMTPETSLHDEIWKVARNIGLERSKATLDALSGPSVHPLAQMELCDAWGQAIALLELEQGKS